MAASYFRIRIINVRVGGGVGSAGKAGAVVLRPDGDQFGDAGLSMAGGAQTRNRKGSVSGGGLNVIFQPLSGGPHRRARGPPEKG